MTFLSDQNKPQERKDTSPGGAIIKGKDGKEGISPSVLHSHGHPETISFRRFR